VQFFAGSNFNGYEQTPPAAQIEVSPALAWEQVPTINKVLGWLFLGALWFAIWFVDTDRFQGKKKTTGPGKRQGLAVILILIPLILCAVFFFGGYSSKLSSNAVSIERVRFDEWIKTGAVEQKGERTYIDKADSIKPLFNKPFIK
jgi:hypothetical protein